MAAYTWDSEVTVTNDERIVFDEGEYSFEVVDFQRVMVNKSAKYKGYPQADYTLKVSRPDGATTQVHERIILDSNFDWKINRFFGAIGMRTEENKDTFQPQWDKCIGKTGTVVLSVVKDTYDGRTFDKNEIAGMKKAAAPAATSAYGTL